jgi:hypothetical protein
METDYTKYSRTEFDAVVTGELAHHCLWMEDALNDFIIKFFLKGSSRKKEFETVFFERECLSFQDKIDLVNVTLKLFGSSEQKSRTKTLLKKVEAFKSMRNAFAHGMMDYSGAAENEQKITIQIYNRGGNVRTHEVTIESHKKQMQIGDNIIADLHQWCSDMVKELNQ